MGVVGVVGYMEGKGVGVESEGLKERWEDLRGGMKEIEEEVEEVGGGDLKIG